MLACSFYPTGLGLGFFEEDLDLDLTVAGLVTSLITEFVVALVFVWSLHVLYATVMFIPDTLVACVEFGLIIQ